MDTVSVIIFRNIVFAKQILGQLPNATGPPAPPKPPLQQTPVAPLSPP